MLFIGTKTEQQEIPFEESNPDFHIEKISGEFLPVQQVFSNPYVYFTGTSRGCSCDFGIKSNQRSEESIGQIAPVQKVLNKVRKVGGSYAESEVQKGNPVEVYCTWTGEYGAAPEFHDTIDTKQVDLNADFEVSENEFKTFI